MSAELKVGAEMYGPVQEPTPRINDLVEAQAADDDQLSAAGLSTEELEGLRGWACAVDNLKPFQAERYLSDDDVDGFFEWADSVNISRVATFECKVAECPVILSARLDQRKVVMTRDESGDCYFRQVSAAEVDQ